MANRLMSVVVDEVSLVRRAANKRQFLILKEDVMEELLALLQVALENEAEVDDALVKAQLSDKAQVAVKGALRLFTAYKDQLPDTFLKTFADLLGYKYESADDSDEPAADEGDEDEPDDSEGDEDAVAKMAELPEWARKKFETVRKEQAETATALQKEVAIRKAREFLDKAVKLDNLPGKTDELASLLMKADIADPKVAIALEKTLTELNASMAELYKERGVDRSAEDAGVMGEIETKAKALVEKDETIKTLEQAMVVVLDRNPELYARYIEEQK